MIGLHYRDFGGEGNPPLIMMHGLFGSSRNWIVAGKDLGRYFHAFGLDLRNHGQSPHVDDHNFQSMTEDVLGWIDKIGFERVHVLGHSMGGKVAMRLACKHPERVKSLIVVDISPRAKEPNYVGEFKLLRELPLDRVSSRAEADRILSERIPSLKMRQFLLTNLVRQQDGSFGWQANLEGLIRNLHETGKCPIEEDDQFEGPALWIVGGKSNFVRADDHDLIRRHFTNARIEVFPQSEHNPHAEDRVRFVETIRKIVLERL